MKATAISGRYLCSILDDMRNCHKTRNYSYLLALIEEVQYRANRMEDRLERVNSVERLEKRYIKLKNEIREMEKKTDE